MAIQQTLVLIKPDGLVKSLTGNIISLLAETGLKLVGADGGKVSIGQAFIRNILIMIPFVLVVGYIVETIFVLSKGHRLGDVWAKTRVVSA